MERQATVWQKISLITYLTKASYISRPYKVLSKLNIKETTQKNWPEDLNTPLPKKSIWKKICLLFFFNDEKAIYWGKDGLLKKWY